MIQRGLALCTALAATLACAAKEPSPRKSGSADLVGAGATFPYPLYRAWFSEFERREGVRINYFAVGSSEGVRLLERSEADFAATDKPSIARAAAGRTQCGRVVIPMVRGPLVVGYHLPPSPDSAVALRLDVATLADIFSGRVKRWNDARIRALNPGRSLPAVPIVVVHRADGSGTSRAFSDFLSTSGRWTVSHAGDTSEVQWPLGIPAEGNAGVALEVKVRIGAIGYMELSYARQNRLAVAAVRGGAGDFVLPGAGATGYPATAVTWLVLEPSRMTADRAEKFVAFVRWAQREGSPQARELEYSQPEPDSIAYYDTLLSRIPFESCAAMRSDSAARALSQDPAR
ncbi:MAG TPA: phosphate ABC transporter substrate-binding protein PstS [Gemmatimonadaceae bacterium]